MDFEIENGSYTWTIENFHLFPAAENYTYESSTFPFANALWLFRLILTRSGDKIYICVELFRTVVGNHPDSVTVEFLVSIRSAETIVAVKENEFDFVKGSVFPVIKFESNWKDFFSAYRNTNKLVIECDISMLHTMKCNYWESDYHPDLEALSEDLGKLLNNNEKEFHDAYLITDGTEIPVLVEILSAYSPVFREEFQNLLPYRKKLQIPYSRVVVEAMLEFLYTGLQGPALISPYFKLRQRLDLYKCADQYKISELLKHFSVWKINTVNVVKSQSLKFILDVPSRNNISVSEPYFEKKISEDIGLTIYRDIDVDKSLNRFKINLRKFSGITPVTVSMIFRILGNDGVEKFKKKCLSSLRCGEENSFVLPIEEMGLSTETLVLTDDIRIQCEYNIASLDVSSICSDLEFLSIRQCFENSNTSSLSISMESLLNWGFYNNVRLDTNNGSDIPFYVHRSIIRARCPELGPLLPHGKDYLYLDVPSNIAKQLVFYIYTGRLLNTDTDFETLYSAAKEYKFTSLQTRCQKVMQSYSSN